MTICNVFIKCIDVWLAIPLRCCNKIAGGKFPAGILLGQPTQAGFPTEALRNVRHLKQQLALYPYNMSLNAKKHAETGMTALFFNLKMCN